MECFNYFCDKLEMVLRYKSLERSFSDNSFIFRTYYVIFKTIYY